MPAPVTSDELIELIRKSGVVEDKRLEPHLEQLRSGGTLPREPKQLAWVLIRDGLLTRFQAEQLLLGKWRRFSIGKYKVLERLGSGGMGSVYLCEHKLMRRRVAVKVLPTAKAKDNSARERFYREARAVAALDHPNIVHAYDIDQDEELHFLVMEYVDGASLQEIVKKSGPLDPIRAAHYVYQACLGLSHAHAAGLVHRDIKPGNLLVERGGTLKILDMGLARFFNDEEDILTKKYDENVLGTADYLAPEQAVDSHEADTRADIYSLGATFYFMLTGRTPFDEGTVAQKLLWHQTRQPKPISSFRADVPPPMLAVIEKMMAKAPEDRYQHPLEVSQALTPWTQQPIAPPPESEMPRLSPAAAGVSYGEPSQTSLAPPSSRRTWQITAPGMSKPPSSGSQAAPASAGQPGMAHIPTAAASTVANRPAQHHANGSPPVTPPPRAASGAAWMETEAEAPSAEEFAEAPAEFAARVRNQPRRGGRWGLYLAGGIILMLIISYLVWNFIVLPIMQPPPVVRGPLAVTKGARPEGAAAVYRSLGAALQGARDNDVIEIWTEHLEENLIVDSKKAKSTKVTVRAAPGREVVWTFQPGHGREELLRLWNAQGFHLEGDGITLAGKDQVPNLIVVGGGQSAGITLENMRVGGFTQSAIQIKNCTGTDTAPVKIRGLQTSTPSSGKFSVIFFDANPQIVPAINNYINIGGCDFGGLPVEKAIQRKDASVTGDHVRVPEDVGW